MAPLEFPAFLERSLELLADEVPEAYAALGRSLARCPLGIVIDGSSSVLWFENGRHALARAGARGAELRTTGSVILALVDGDATLLETLRSDALFLRGTTDAIAHLDTALGAYLAGAVRAPSFPRLLDRYRRSIAAPRPSRGADDAPR